MIRKERAWKAKVYYKGGRTSLFLLDDDKYSHHIGKPVGFLTAGTYTYASAHHAAIEQAGSLAQNAEVWPVQIEYDTKTKQAKEIESNYPTGRAVTDYLGGETNVERGRLFEDFIEQKLGQMFHNVRRNVWAKGRSGEIWQMDFLINDTFVIEATTEKRSEIKINTSFLKFIDIRNAFQNNKFAIVFAEAYKKVYGMKGMEKRRYMVPLAPHKAFLAENFTFVVVDDMERLLSFYKGELDAYHTSSIPQEMRPN